MAEMFTSRNHTFGGAWTATKASEPRPPVADPMVTDTLARMSPCGMSIGRRSAIMASVMVVVPPTTLMRAIVVYPVVPEGSVAALMAPTASTPFL